MVYIMPVENKFLNLSMKTSHTHRMEQYIVSARKYRPSTFNSVVGQKALTATLKNAIVSDRLAHAYLFCGSRGVGKTSCARIFAKTINCTHRTADGEACNECESCRSFNDNRSLNIIELDAASHNGIDDMKALMEQVMVPPTQGRYRVFIIDEVHMLTTAAFNAFLKTLEEPPSYVIFILATTEKHKIIPTILSRCQIYDFNRITIQDMVDHLSYVASQEGISAEPSALNIIARKADGAMRDALSIFDQVAASSMGNVSYRNTIDNLNVLDHSYYSILLDAFLSGDVPKALLTYKDIREKGFDPQFFINGLAMYLRDIMVARDPATITLLEATDDVKEEMAERARLCPPKFLYSAMDLCNDADLNFRIATNKQFLIELTLIKLCQLPDMPTGNGTEGNRLKPMAKPSAPQPAATPPADTGTKPSQAAAPWTDTIEPSPVPAPATANTTNNTVARRTSIGPGLSIKGGLAKPEEKTVAQAAKQHRDNPYSDDAVESLWNAYISAHPTAHILINTMRTARPRRIEDDRFAITVENEIQVQTMQTALNDILTYLHDRLLNDNLSIEILLNQGEPSPITWNEREVLAHMIETTPSLKSFIQTFRLTIS